MVKDILALASFYQKQLQPLTKVAGKEKMNRGRLAKSLEKAKANYSRLKSELDSLEVNDAKLKDQLEKTRTGASGTRKQIMQMHKAMQCMDLANANDAIFYADDEDVGYVIDGKEFHLDVDDVGEVKLTPMSAHRKSKKTKKNETCADENCVDDSHAHFAPGSKKIKMEEDDSEANDEEDDKQSGNGEFDDLYASLLK